MVSGKSGRCSEQEGKKNSNDPPALTRRPQERRPPFPLACPRVPRRAPNCAIPGARHTTPPRAHATGARRQPGARAHVGPRPSQIAPPASAMRRLSRRRLTSPWLGVIGTRRFGREEVRLRAAAEGRMIRSNREQAGARDRRLGRDVERGGRRDKEGHCRHNTWNEFWCTAVAECSRRPWAGVAKETGSRRWANPATEPRWCTKPSDLTGNAPCSLFPACHGSRCSTH